MTYIYKIKRAGEWCTEQIPPGYQVDQIDFLAALLAIAERLEALNETAIRIEEQMAMRRT